MLSLTSVLKQQIRIKNQTYYFYNDIINIEESDSNLLKIDQKSYKHIDIYYIGYVTIKKVDHCENIYSVNPLHLKNGEVDGHVGCNSIKEKNGSKYLVFDSTDESKEVLKKYTETWDGIRNEIEAINGSKKSEYDKDFIKIKLNTDNNLPLSKPLKLHLLNITVWGILKEDNKFYLQVYLGNFLYELCV